MKNGVCANNGFENLEIMLDANKFPVIKEMLRLYGILEILLCLTVVIANCCQGSYSGRL